MLFTRPEIFPLFAKLLALSKQLWFAIDSITKLLAIAIMEFLRSFIVEH